MIDYLTERDILDVIEEINEEQNETTLTDTLIKQAANTHILRYFQYAHLPGDLRVVSQRFAMLASELVDALPDGPERAVALRKLLEAKDAAVRASLPE